MHQSYIQNMARTLAGDGQVRTTTKVETGKPRESICTIVEKSDIDLIIMTTGGTSGVNIPLLGSVADHVCRAVPIPVMLIKPQAAEQAKGKARLVNRILLPFDGSELSKQALPVAEELAAKLKVPIVLFQMVQIIYPYAAADTAFIDYTKLTKDEEERVRAEMAALEKELKGKGLDTSNVVTTGTDAASEIIEVGKKVGADLVVMSTHGRSGLSRWVFGSVAEKVLRQGEAPLLLVNARAS